MANDTEEDISLKMVGLELMFLTPEKYSNEDGITAVELAKLVNLPVEIVKKKLNILKIRRRSQNQNRINPKKKPFRKNSLMLLLMKSRQK